MDYLFLIVSLGFAGLALYFLSDFLIWQSKGRVILAEITGFQDKKNKGLKLPIVSFQKRDDTPGEAKVERIDQMLFLLNRPKEGDYTTIIYRGHKKPRARVYGYINVLAAVFLFLPLVAAIGMQVGDDGVLTQIAYIVIFMVMAVGGWVLLKLIQRYY